MSLQQNTILLRHFKTGKTISSLEARAVYQIERLASRVHDLKRMGHVISAVMHKDEAGHRYCRYRLVREAAA